MNQRLSYILILILMTTTIVLGVKCWMVSHSFEGAVNRQSKTVQLIKFADLFVNQVLLTEGEVDFETRLKLENTVRELKDPELLNEWKLFTESKDESSAQQHVKRLLGMLVSRIAETSR